MRYVGEGRFGSRLLGGYLVLFFLFLETPIIIIVLASFNDGPTVRFPPIGFSLQWYRELLHLVQDGSGTKPGLLKALWTSAGLGVVSMVGAIFAGVLAAYGIERYRFRGRALLRQALLLLRQLFHALRELLVLRAQGRGFRLGGLEAGFDACAVSNLPPPAHIPHKEARSGGAHDGDDSDHPAHGCSG